jgi:aspartate-semialdehyde dehydrogenase
MVSRGRTGPPVVAIVGATGAVGVEMLGCLERRRFPLSELRLLASARSAGKQLEFRGRPLAVRELTESSFEGVDLALFSAGSSVAKKFAPLAVRAGAIVIDNSSAFRMDAAVPLVVPEINPLAAREHRGIIANPNCTAIISITPLWTIHQANRIVRLRTSVAYHALRSARVPTQTERSTSVAIPSIWPAGVYW